MSALVTLLGLVALVVIPAKAYALAIAATLVMALGYGMLKSEVDGGLAVYTGSEYQSGVYALANLFSSGLGIVVTALCAVLYPHSPAGAHHLHLLREAAGPFHHPDRHEILRTQ